MQRETTKQSVRSFRSSSEGTLGVTRSRSEWSAPARATAGSSASPWRMREAGREQRDRSKRWLPAPPPQPMYEGQLGTIQAEAESLWRNTTLNHGFLPVSKLPPLRPDPRQLFAGRPPSCCPVLGDSRALKIIERWESMPQLPSQLDHLHLDVIQEAEAKAEAKARQRCGRCGADGKTWPEEESQSSSGPTHSARTRSRTTEPFRINIKCTCCEHPVPKPWMVENRLTVGTLARAYITSAMDGEESASPSKQAAAMSARQPQAEPQAPSAPEARDTRAPPAPPRFVVAAPGQKGQPSMPGIVVQAAPQIVVAQV